MEERIIKDNRESDEISMKDLIIKLGEWYNYLLSKWIVICALGILGGFLGFCYAWSKKPVYRATTTFVLEDSDKGGGLGQYAGLASMAGLDLGGGGGGIFQGDNLLELYKSRTMIERTLLTQVNYKGKKVLLLDLYVDLNKLREGWNNKPELKGIVFKDASIEPTRLQDSILSKVVGDINKNYLKVGKPDKKLSIINVDVTARDEFFAKTFNEQIVKNVNDFYIQTKIKKSLQNIAILQQKTDSVRSVMNGDIYTGAAIADATPNLNVTRQKQRIAPVQKSQFSAETNKLMLGELVKNLELSKISLRKETPLIQVIDVPVFPLEMEKLGKIKGAIIGGILFGFLSVFFLILKRMFLGVIK